jgi:hypothetical protein
MGRIKEDPEYLRNRSRNLHASYRRNRRFSKWFLVFWTLLCTALFLISFIDSAAGLGWGYSWNDVWTSLGFLAFTGVFWLFAAAIQKILMAYVRHTYGPDPAD